MTSIVTILKPRLDVPFKNFGPIPTDRSPLSPIRLHWANFLDRLEARLLLIGHEVNVVEKPLWQFTLEYVKTEAMLCDRIYIPHKQKSNFDVGSNALYYHQTVFPEYFTIDQNGWGAGISWINDIDLESPLTTDEKIKVFSFESRVHQNLSKFNQPISIPQFPFKDYYLFVCQIPHDETFQYSPVTAEEALETTLQYAARNNKKVLVKGHPVNPGSMESQRALATKYGATYVDYLSIHDCIRHCEAVFLVNSGVGFEAILHGKEVFRFGDAEYRNVTCQVNGTIIDYMVPYVLSRRDEYYEKQKKFLVRFFAHCSI
jgi:hypothetical protein